MTMPKTSINEDEGLVFWQHYIGFTEQIFNMKAVTETLEVQKFTNKHFVPGNFCL